MDISCLSQDTENTSVHINFYTFCLFCVTHYPFCIANGNEITRCKQHQNVVATNYDQPPKLDLTRIDKDNIICAKTSPSGCAGTFEICFLFFRVYLVDLFVYDAFLKLWQYEPAVSAWFICRTHHLLIGSIIASSLIQRILVNAFVTRTWTRHTQHKVSLWRNAVNLLQYSMFSLSHKKQTKKQKSRQI